MILDDYIVYSESILPGGKDSHINLPLALKEYFRTNLDRLDILENIYKNMDNLSTTQQSILDEFINNAPIVPKNELASKDIIIPSDKAGYIATPKEILLRRKDINDTELSFAIVDRKQVARGQIVKYMDETGRIVGQGYISKIDRSIVLTKVVNLMVAIKYVHTASIHKWWTKEVLSHTWVNTDCLDLSSNYSYAALDLEFIVPAYHKPGLVRWSLYYNNVLMVKGNDYSIRARAEVLADNRSKWKAGKYEIKAKRLNLKGKVVAHVASDTDITRMIDRLQFISTGKIDYKKSLYLI